MPRLIDVWRAVDPEARRLGGSADATLALVRGVSRTRALPPHLPPPATGQLLIVDGALVDQLPPQQLVVEIAFSGVEPAGVLVAAVPGSGSEWPATPFAVLASRRSVADLVRSVSAYLADEADHLDRFRAALRLAAAEAALSDPRPAAAAALVAQRLRRGVGVVADGDLVTLIPRPAGRALAARFGAAFSRLLAGHDSRAPVTRRLGEGLWTHERRIGPGAAVWVFDDLPLSATDEAAAEALAITLRALLRRRAVEVPARVRPRPEEEGSAGGRVTPAGEVLTATLLAVARANGRVAPAARSLGVHRNTVLYRLRVARDERGIDPRRPEDALRLLREADRSA